MGGSKKASKAPIKRESKYKIPAYFNCPLCDAKHSVVVKLDRSKKTGNVRCRVCEEPKQAEYSFVPGLEKKVDVFFRFFEQVTARDQENLVKSGVKTNQVRKTNGLDQLFDGGDLEERRDAAHIFDAADPEDYDNDDNFDRLFGTD
jgi:transcription elongation factor Elf1